MEGGHHRGRQHEDQGPHGQQGGPEASQAGGHCLLHGNAVELEIDNFLICYVAAGNCDDHAIRIPSRWLPRRISLVLSHYKHPSHASQVNHPVMETRSEIQMSRRE